MQVHYDAAHRWYYLEDQEPSELLVFRQTNSHPNGQLGMSGDSECNILIDKTAYLGKGVPHSSFPNPLAGGDELPRESIEVRTIVSYSNVA